MASPVDIIELAILDGRIRRLPSNAHESSLETAEQSSAMDAQQVSQRMIEERTTGDQEERLVPPNGGFQAWLLVAAGFCVYVNTWGLTSTYGSFSAFYESDFLSNKSSSAVSWIGSVQAFLIVFLGVVVGPLFDRGYLRSLVFTGCFLTVFGMMMTSLAKEYYQVFLAQAVCVGLGEGMTYVPSMAVVAKSFTTKRPIAIGVSSVGACVGGVIFPIMFRKLQPRTGFGWALRSIAFINLGLAVLAIAILGRHRSQAHQARSLIDRTALQESTWTVFTAGLLFIEMGYWVPLFFIVSFAKYSLHTSDDFAFYLLAITNGGSFLGRTVPYILGQRIKPIFTLVLSSLVGVILIFAWIGIHSSAELVVFCVLWGFVAGVLVTAPASTMAHPVMSPSLDVIGTRLGMMWAAASLGSLVGTPVAGALAEVHSASFVHAQLFGGAAMSVGVLCFIWPLVAIERYDRERARQ